MMSSFEFVERLEEQGLKHYSDLWRVAACMLRLTKPWHNECPRILPADYWFSWMPISFALVQEGLYSVVNVETRTKFCKKDLWEDTRPRLLFPGVFTTITGAMSTHNAKQAWRQMAN
jgi:hypothetical protein